MRKIIFEVPSDLMGDFTEKLIELELSNSIIGTNDDDEIEVEVCYEKGESDAVDELETFLEELKEDDDDEDDDDD